MKTKLYFLIVFTILEFSKVLNAQNKWEYLPNIGLDSPANRFQDVYFTNYQTGFAVSLPYKTFKTNDGGTNWRVVANGTTGVSGGRSIEFLDGGKIGIAGGFNGKIARTDDSGETWNDIAASIPDTATDFSKHGICGISHYNNSFYAVGIFGSTTAHFYTSKDKGISWTTKYIDTNLINGLVDVCFTSEDIGFISGTKIRYGSGEFGVVLKTTDGGNTWRKVFEGKIGALNAIWKLQFIGSNFGVGAIQTNDTIAMIKSIDGGENWTIIGSGFKPANFYYYGGIGTQSVGFVTPLKGWLGGYFGGIVETNDGGVTWDSLSFGLNFNRIFVMDSNHAYAAGKSIYRYGSNFDLSISKKELATNTLNTLYPISPNPSKGKIKIEFDISVTTNAILQVVQVATGKIWDIDRKRLTTGHYTYFWEDPAAASGAYIVRLNNEDIALFQKFILSK